ncbi:MAG: DUF2125 domain-containing protein [Zavarzinia sp.]|nr:DUF2125 domain-containing protein [Zavarzinia sp.]
MRRSRRYLYLTLFVIAAVGAWSTFWFYLAGQVRTRTDEWIARQAAQGVEVAYTDLAVNGYPYRIEVTVSNLTASGPRLPGKGALAVPKLTVLSLPWNPRLVVGSIEGEVLFRWTDPKGIEQRATYTAESTGFSLGLEDGQAARFAFSGSATVLRATTLPGPVSAKVFEVHARRFAGGPAPEGEPAGGGASPTAPLLGEIAIDAEAVQLPPGIETPLGPTIESAGYTIGLTGQIPPLAQGQDPRLLVDEWARNGGTVELSRAETKWGPLDLTLTGSFSVDGQRRPIGAIAGRVGGLDPLVDAAVARGDMTEGQAAGVKRALNTIGFIARDAQGRVPVSVTIQDGKVKVGPVPVGEVRPLF